MNNLVLVKNKQGELQKLVNESKIDQQLADDIIIIQGTNYRTQPIEQTVKYSHPSLRSNAGVVFSVKVGYQERLVVMQEVKRTYLRILNVDEVIQAIRSAVFEKHGLQIYAVVLLKTSNLSKDSNGKINRHICQNTFLNANLDALHTWTLNLQQDLQQLQTDVNILLENVQMFVQQSQVKVS